MTEICKQFPFPTSYRFYSQLYLEYLDQSRRLCNRQKIYKLGKYLFTK